MARVRLGTSSAYLLAYLVAVVLGRQLVVPGTGLALFWPAAGIAALWMMRGSRASQVVLDGVLLALSTLVTNVLLDVSFGAALVFGLANLVVGIGARLVFSYAERAPLLAPVAPAFRTPSDLFVVALAAFASAVVSMPLGLVGSRLIAGSWSEPVAIAWIVRNACGCYLVVTYVLALRESHRQRTGEGLSFVETLSSRRRPSAGAELLLTTVVTLTMGFLIFAERGQEPIAFLVVAAAAWIGFRFAPVVGGSYTVVFAVIAVVCTVNDLGPFGAVTDPASRATIVQSYLAVIGSIALMLSLGTAERIALTRRAQASEAAARDQADLLRGVTDVMDEGVVVVDRTGEVLVSNPIARRLLPSMTPGHLSSATSYGVFQLDGSPVLDDERPHRRLLDGQPIAPIDLLGIDPITGEHRTLTFSGIPLPVVGRPEEYLALLLVRDVTKERTETRELQAFAGVVAHDLKNPLASVMSWSEILDEQLDELEVDASAARSSLVRVYRTADRMQQLISDLLTFTRTRSAEIEVDSLALNRLVDEVAEDVVEHLRGQRPRIVRGELDRVCADVTLVRQVFANLIGNAVKYVADGVQPVVEVTTRRRGDMVEVRIADNGLGIPRSEQGKVFDTFYRSTSTHDLPGTGLGLAICAKAVERHGGSIAAQSGPDGRGTVMVFTLPADPDDLLQATDGPHLDGGVQEDQREGRTTSAEPPPRRTGSETAVS